MSRAKKIAAVLATSTSMTPSSEALQRVPCIWYPIQFQGSQNVKTLIDSGSESM